MLSVLTLSAPVRRRDRVYRVVTQLLSVVSLPVACAVAPRRARLLACRWALAVRFPAENLKGLTPATRAAFEAARTEALWYHGELIGLTDGHRDAHKQARLFSDAIRRTGSVHLALQRALPPNVSRHVTGTALDVRPVEGARWLELHGDRHHLYRIYDNEWWHFEYRPDGRPPRLPHPGASMDSRTTETRTTETRTTETRPMDTRATETEATGVCAARTDRP